MKKQVSKTTPEPTESGAMAPGVEAFASTEPEIVTKSKARKKKVEVVTASAIEVTPIEAAPEARSGQEAEESHAWIEKQESC